MEMNSISFWDALYLRDKRMILQNVISSVALFTLRTLLHGVNEFDFTENKKIINETLQFIHEQNGLSDAMCKLSCDLQFCSPSDCMCSLFIV